MRAPVSVVIPTLDAAARLPSCLAALMEGVEAGLIRELVISDGGSRDATAEIAQEAGAALITGEASRGGQLRRGARVAKGEWLLFVHADTVLAPGWAAAVAAHIEGGQARAACFRLRFDTGGLRPALVAGWANLRTRALGLPYGDQGLLVTRGMYDAAGGYRDIPLMEDVAMARALRGRPVLLPVSARTSAARYVAEGWFRRGLRNLWTLARYLCGADPSALSRGYRRSGHRS
ncbi:MAG: glycosyltransferase [Sediminimonas qiaohouensis]|uniref:Glycosyltransferase n=1 Tax=Sediminimonas qiaohouensis TaxID=552061 RepID=A0A7C9HB67_9RHOB|nr:TIGR04283 family arsenosugar biosynthesis glycosyltransferase [Sediminimonas qiaohouensis]MTJ04951.1 glycosyltransferase [Sediminimonas qiaohouensis]